MFGLDDAARRHFDDELSAVKFDRKGLVATANKAPGENAGAFFITLANRPIDSLFKKHTIFGEVAEGLDVLERINRTSVNKEARPYQNIRIKHTTVIDDPFEGKEAEFGVKLRYPERSPSPVVVKQNVDLKSIDF